jgi:hypothetical protein
MLLLQSVPVTIDSQWLAELSAVTRFAGPFGVTGKNGMEKLRGDGHEARTRGIKKWHFCDHLGRCVRALFVPSPGIHVEEG